MEYISLIVNEDAAHDCLADLGKLGVIQFTDVSQRFCCDCIFYSIPSNFGRLGRNWDGLGRPATSFNNNFLPLCNNVNS